MARPTLRQIQQMQARSLGYLLIRCSQIWGDRAIAAVNFEAGGPILREAHTRLLPYLQNPAGIRITDLAQAVGVTKQAVQPLVAELVTIGLVRLETDAEDGRARRAYLTAFGLDALAHGTGLLLQIEEELAPQLGQRTRDGLRKQLAKLLAVLEAPPEPANPVQPGPPSPAQARTKSKGQAQSRRRPSTSRPVELRSRPRRAP